MGLYPSNHRDPVATLRLIADEIEAGNYGDVSAIGVAMLSDTIDVFGMGPEADAATISVILGVASRRLAENIAR